MPTFLQLCVTLTEESGGAGRPPTSVVGQVGRQKKIVNWVRDAWVKVQNLSPYWRFLRGEFEKALTIGQTTYTADAWSIPRFGEWLGDYGRTRTMSLYDPAIGRADQAYLRQVLWDQWRARYDFGTHAAQRPSEYAIASDGGLRLGAKPDKPYLLRGEYRKTPQILAADNDVPDMPGRFHDIIVRRAIMLMAESDEGAAALSTSSSEYLELKAQMERELLPAFTVRSERPIA